MRRPRGILAPVPLVALAAIAGAVSAWTAPPSESESEPAGNATWTEPVVQPQRTLPAFGLAFWEAMPGPMPLPVFDAAAAMAKDHLIVVGGFTRELAATQAIQIRHPIHGWLPVGSSLLEPRAQATLTPLPNGRTLVLGGFSGTWGRDARARADGETLDLLRAGSGRTVPAWPFPLEGHTATRLPDGRVAVACGRELRLLDATGLAWSEPIALAAERRHHAAVLLGTTLILIGGDDRGSIESIHLAPPVEGQDAEPIVATLWEATLPTPWNEPAAVVLPDDRILLIGGIERTTGDTSDGTCLLFPHSQRTKLGPPLGLPNGACRLFVAEHPRGTIVLDGEWRRNGERGSANAALLITAPAEDGPLQIWRLPSIAGPSDVARRTLVLRLDGTIESLGGYRFVAPDQPQANVPAGISVDGSGQRLVVDAAGVAD